MNWWLYIVVPVGVFIVTIEVKRKWDDFCDYMDRNSDY